MADSKVSALTALTGANVASDDKLLIVDTSATASKRIDASELASYVQNKTTGLTALDSTTLATGDEALVYDVSATASKKITAVDLSTYALNQLSGLTALTGANVATDDKLLISDTSATASKRIDISELVTYLRTREPVFNASVANQSFTTSDAYVTGSFITIPTGMLQAKMIYRARFQMTKTSSTSSTATPIITIRLGTAGTTSDTARCTLTFAAQTAVADVGFFDIDCTFRTVGSGSSAVLQATGRLTHALGTTGLSTANVSIQRATSAGFDSTTANLGIGFSFNGGASYAGNTDLVQAELFNGV